MTILQIYEKINLVMPLEQRKFINYFSDTVSELEAMYHDYLFLKGETYSAPKNLQSENTIRPLYHECIVDNILFLGGQNEVYKSEFLRKARQAYNKYWTDDAKGKRIKRARW